MSEAAGERKLPDRLVRSWTQLSAIRRRYVVLDVFLLLVTFAAGFAFSAWTLTRIDHRPALIRQGAALALLGALLVLGERPADRELPQWLGKALRYSEAAIHFLLGNLLSLITLFYFKSASGLTSMAFLVLVFGALVANEVPRFRRLGGMVRFGLYSFCLTSYLAYLLPVLMGFMYPGLFVVAACVASLLLFVIFKLLQRRVAGDRELLRRALLPAVGVQLALVGLYLLKAIPPVPLAVQFMGIYHQVERAGAQYRLQHEGGPKWKPWVRGEQRFQARPGDRVYCFVRIFAPTSFQETVRLRWLYDEPKRGWQTADVIPLPITGGRAEGYRGFAFKSNYQPGRWLVEVETTDGRELGSLAFTIVPDASTEPRSFREDVG